MFTLIRSYAISVLRSPSTWLVVLGASFFAWAGIALDLFGFDGSPHRSVGLTIGTFELAVVLLATRARLAGIASNEAEGFRAAVSHKAGALALEVGCATGVGAGASLACVPAIAIIFVLYNLHPNLGWTMGTLLAAALATEASLAAVLVGVFAKVAGRVPAIAIVVGAFVLARSSVPSPLRAILPAPLPLGVAELLTNVTSALLATLGLAVIASVIPDANTENA